MKDLSRCHGCGMVLNDASEFHPYAACLMFKGCHDGDTVRANLGAVESSTAEPSVPMWPTCEVCGAGGNCQHRDHPVGAVAESPEAAGLRLIGFTHQYDLDFPFAYPTLGPENHERSIAVYVRDSAPAASGNTATARPDARSEYFRGFNDCREATELAERLQRIAGTGAPLLSDEQIDRIAEEIYRTFGSIDDEAWERKFARAIEQAVIAAHQQPK